MKTFDVQSVGIEAPVAQVFEFIAEAGNLPRWTNAFESVSGGEAMLATPQGTVGIKLDTSACRETGTIDWRMTFPDGAVGTAFSRVTPDGEAKSVYSFVLMAPPVALEVLEGALEAQRALLANELLCLKRILEQK
jgi:hypothetical protein